MFQIIQGISVESVELFKQMSPYLIFGFFFAGILHVVFSLDTIAKHLGKSSVTSVIKAVIFGIPLPLCSCGVIPSAILLRKKGASRGAVLSFLVATPITGIDSILATYSLLGLVFAICRVVASSVTAFVTGIISNLVFGEECEKCGESLGSGEDDHSCDEEVDKGEITRPERSIKELFKYAFIELYGDVWKWLVAGIIIGGAIAYLIPDTYIQKYLGSGWQAMLVMLVVGIPMYICSTGSIPIAAALMLKGMSPGAALVFLLAGPATNAVTITIVSRELGKKAAAVYVISIAVMSVLMGISLDGIWQYLHATLPSAVAMKPMLPEWVEVASAVILVVLILFLVLRSLIARFKGKADSCSHCH